tara:strand:- start:196 stop:600 length:405 start_codon:yes stop_codon:yes gene_type:complete
MGNIVLYKDTLSDEELTKHRAWIAVKAQALMGRYFQLPQDELVKRDILLGWMDTLQNFTDKEISSACATFLKRHPRTRPHEGHIYNIVIEERKRQAPRISNVIEKKDEERNLSLEERKRISKYAEIVLENINKK